MTETYLSVKQAAEYLGIGVSTIWRLSKNGDLPKPVRIGGATRWRLSDIEAQLSQEGI